jgi:hypothetical protein
MLDAGEAAELRTLQARAYGRDGGLNAVDAARLRDLERRRVAGSTETRTPVPVAIVDRVPWTADPLPAVERGSPRDETSDTAAGVEPAEPDPGGRTAGIEHWFTTSRWRVLAGAAAVLVVGVGLGWLLFGRDPGPAIPITAEQQARGVQLAEEGEFDAGSMIPVAEDDEVLIWMSTQKDGETTCLVLDDGENSAKSCDATDRLSDVGLHGMLTLASGEESEDGEEVLSASMILSHDGQPMVHTLRGNSGGVDFLEQFTDAEQRAMAERLLDDGFDDWSPMIAGYDGDVPIWVGTREFGQEVCLYYGDDAEAPSACGSIEDAQTSGISLSVMSFTDEPGAASNARNVTLRYGVNGIAALTVENSDGSSAPTGATRPDPYDLNDYTYDDITGEPNE